MRVLIPIKVQQQASTKSLKDFDNDIHAYLEYLFRSYNLTFFKRKLTLPILEIVKSVKNNIGTEHKTAKGIFLKPNTIHLVDSLFSGLKIVDIEIIEGIKTPTLTGKLSKSQDKALRVVLLHEMCHQAVYQIEKCHNNEDGNHGPLWKKWMKICGLPISKIYENTVITNPVVGESCSIILNANTIKEQTFYGRICKVKRNSVLCVVKNHNTYIAGEFPSNYIFTCGKSVQVPTKIIPTVIKEYDKRTDDNPNIGAIVLDKNFKVIEEIEVED